MIFSSAFLAAGVKILIFSGKLRFFVTSSSAMTYKKDLGTNSTLLSTVTDLIFIENSSTEIFRSYGKSIICLLQLGVECLVKVLVVLSRLQQFQEVLILGLAGGAVVLVVGEALEAVLVKAVLAEEVDRREFKGMMTRRAPEKIIRKRNGICGHTALASCTLSPV